MPEVSFRYPRADLLRALADRRGTTVSTLVRSLADAALEAEGFAVGVGLPGTQYALVANGEILALTFRPVRDDRGEWLPIENEDSSPFDPALHWRLKPLPLRVDGDRVVRTYPVVAKSMEQA
ncbi:hypothetical protein [Bradyrhizobium sp. ORS 86]|uniref:hypothetical protein n=1 Tax=Bradyrhizobium sp. ORS 86 TaxID=1685970 RepID=UPI00388F13B5